MRTNPTALAAIRWHRPEPTGKYTAPMRTELQGEDEGAWSLVCEPTGDGLTWTVSFLAPTAPHHWLIQGLKFRLYEGVKAVAQGVIIV